MRPSVVIPAHNEAGVIELTVRRVGMALAEAGYDQHEVIVVDDASTDDTGAIVERLASEDGRVRYLRSHYATGFGFAVRAGLEVFEGDAVALVMADASDDPDDLVLYFRLIEQGYDCAFGSRFVPGAEVHDYPEVKLLINRVVNLGIKLLFRHRYNDTTNAFKAYSRETVESCRPLVSNHFNLTVELPLKAVVRGHSYAIVPVRWRNRTSGRSKLALREMGSRYVYIILMVFLEHHLARGDYRRPDYREVRARAGGGAVHLPRSLPRR